GRAIGEPGRVLCGLNLAKGLCEPECDESVHLLYDFNSGRVENSVDPSNVARFFLWYSLCNCCSAVLISLAIPMSKLKVVMWASSLLSCSPCFPQSPSSPPQTSDLLTIDQAVAEAVEKNLGLLAERYNLSIAEARLITAHLRPNPVLTLDADHQDLLGT